MSRRASCSVLPAAEGHHAPVTASLSASRVSMSDLHSCLVPVDPGIPPEHLEPF